MRDPTIMYVPLWRISTKSVWTRSNVEVGAGGARLLYGRLWIQVIQSFGSHMTSSLDIPQNVS